MTLQPLPARRVTRLAAWGMAGLCCLCLLSGPSQSAEKPVQVAAFAPKIEVANAPDTSLLTFSDFPDWVACATFSPDGRMVAAGSYGVIKLLDPTAKKELGTLTERRAS